MSDVAEAVQRAAQAPQIVLREVKVLVAEHPIVVRASGELAFTRGPDSDGTAATMLLFDPQMGAFRPVLTPPGTSWELVEKRQGPALWTPGRQS